MNKKIDVTKLIEFINEEIANEKETARDEPINSHIGSMAMGAVGAYFLLLEWIEEN